MLLSPFMYCTRSTEAVKLGGSGGLSGKYITTRRKTSPPIPASEINTQTKLIYRKAYFDEDVIIQFTGKP